jgi:alkanesulfonate monooxygenase SsuD/methylene tetrahydromethanopterin reductase-like flavin-dependent oxidoreductase (luciferase family)
VQRLGYEDTAREVQDLYLSGKKEDAAAALPGELIDKVSLCGPPDRIRDRLGAYRDAGVGTMVVTPMSFVPEERLQMVRQLADLL